LRNLTVQEIWGDKGNGGGGTLGADGVRGGGVGGGGSGGVDDAGCESSFAASDLVVPCLPSIVSRSFDNGNDSHGASRPIKLSNETFL